MEGFKLDEISVPEIRESHMSVGHFNNYHYEIMVFY